MVYISRESKLNKKALVKNHKNIRTYKMNWLKWKVYPSQTKKLLPTWMKIFNFPLKF